MRRIALASLLALSGCGYDTWSDAPFSSGTNPHFPAGDSENLRRVTGEQFETPVLTPEPGDIWPGPLPPSPTLQDLEQQGGVQPGVERPVPGSPEFQQNQGPSNQQPPSPPPPPAARGSSTPPAPTQPGLAPLKAPSPPPPTNTTPPARNPGGQIVQTPQGPGVTTGGTPGYQTITTPGGGTAIVVPNGNGTNTIIHSDGRIETVPATR
jgi:hypothetical protein